MTRAEIIECINDINSEIRAIKNGRIEGIIEELETQLKEFNELLYTK